MPLLKFMSQKLKKQLSQESEKLDSNFFSHLFDLASFDLLSLSFITGQMFGRRLLDLNRLSPALIRRIHLAPRLLKWLSAEEAKRVTPIAIGPRHGHLQDPEINTFDYPYYGTPGKGEMIKKSK
jgi:hypothetical protein